MLASHTPILHQPSILAARKYISVCPVTRRSPSSAVNGPTTPICTPPHHQHTSSYGSRAPTFKRPRTRESLVVPYAFENTGGGIDGAQTAAEAGAASSSRQQQQDIDIVKSAADETSRRQDEEDDTILFRFKVPYVTNFGESLKIVGSLDELGAWNQENGMPMEWSEGHLWQSQLRLPRSVPGFEFKIVVTSPDGGCRWEGISGNRSVQIVSDIETPGIVSVELNCIADTESTDIRVLIHADTLQGPMEICKARLELQETRRTRLQTFLSKANEAYHKALKQISKSRESMKADRAYTVVQELENELSMLEKDTAQLHEEVDQASHLLQSWKLNGALLSLPSEAGKVSIPGILSSRVLSSSQDPDLALSAAAAAAAAAAIADPLPDTDPTTAAADAASTADNSADGAENTSPARSPSRKSSDALLAEAQEMREAASSLRSFVLPSPNGRGAAELLPNPPRPQFLAAIPNSLGQISADGPPSNTFLDQTLQSLEQVPLPGESPLPGPRAGGAPSSGMQPHFSSFLHLLQYLGDLGYLGYVGLLKVQQQMQSSQSQRQLAAASQPEAQEQEQQQTQPFQPQKKQQQQQQTQPAPNLGFEQMAELAAQEAVDDQVTMQEADGETAAHAAAPQPSPEIAAATAWLEDAGFGEQEGSDRAGAAKEVPALPEAEAVANSIAHINTALQAEVAQVLKELGVNQPGPGPDSTGSEAGNVKVGETRNGVGGTNAESSSSRKSSSSSSSSVGNDGSTTSSDGNTSGSAPKESKVPTWGKQMPDGSLYFTNEDFNNEVMIKTAQQSLQKSAPTSPAFNINASIPGGKRAVQVKVVNA